MFYISISVVLSVDIFLLMIILIIIILIMNTLNVRRFLLETLKD